MDTLLGVVTLSKLFLLPSEKNLKGNNLVSLGANSFLFIVDSFLEGTSCIGMQTKSHMGYLSSKEMIENPLSVSIPLNIFG